MKITPQTKMGDLLEVYPGAKRVLFSKWHVGGCGSCGFAPTDTLEQVLKAKTFDVAEAAAELERAREAETKLLVEPRELDGWLRKGAKVVDLRPEGERKMCPIDGATPATQELVDEIFDKWPRETSFALLCHKGDHSLAAALNLFDQGFTGVRAIRGGIDAYSAEVDPLLPRY